MDGKKNHQGSNDPPKHVEEHSFNELGASRLGPLRQGFSSGFPASIQEILIKGEELMCRLYIQGTLPAPVGSP